MPPVACGQIKLQKVYAPGQPLRNKPGMTVRVGHYYPRPGSPTMRRDLARVLAIHVDPYRGHIAFEKLHPFLDGNERTGRTVWAWLMQVADRDSFTLPFLHRWYYQSLDAAD